MKPLATLSAFPKHILALAALYCVASLIHFAHNAEYIAFYPNMPAWITRENVYVAWLATTSVGIVGLVLLLVGFPLAAALCIGAYGSLGLDGLGHYALALCSQHTFAMNFTIWFEVITGVVLTIACARLVKQRVSLRGAAA